MWSLPEIETVAIAIVIVTATAAVEEEAARDVSAVAEILTETVVVVEDVGTLLDVEPPIV